MIYVMWVLLGILWTVVVLIAGYASGKASVEEINIGLTGPEGPEGPQGHTGPVGMGGPPGVCEHTDEVKMLHDLVESLLSRMTRVERKAGMSV